MADDDKGQRPQTTTYGALRPGELYTLPGDPEGKVYQKTDDGILATLITPKQDGTVVLRHDGG